MSTVKITVKLTTSEAALSVGALIFTDLGRRQDHKGDGKGYRSSVWSSAAHKAAENVPERPPIDWNAIRENKDKYDEMKWKGEGMFRIWMPLVILG